MIKDGTRPVLLQKLLELLEVHRSAFGQERVYWRAVGMVLGEIFNFGRHTVTPGLMALGIIDGDWSGGYRLYNIVLPCAAPLNFGHFGHRPQITGSKESFLFGLSNSIAASSHI